MRPPTRTVLEVVAVWSIATAIVLVFAAETRVGPSIHLYGRHGVHVGDVAALIVLWSIAALSTVRRLRRSDA